MRSRTRASSRPPHPVVSRRWVNPCRERRCRAPLGVGLALLAPLLADLFDVPRLDKVLLVTAAARTLNSVFQLFRLGLNSLGASWQMLGLVVVESVVEVIASLTLVFATATAFAAMTGRIVGYGCGFALGLWLFTRRAHRRGRPSPDVVRRVFSAGVFIGVAEGVYILFTQVDTLLIGATLGPASVAQFEAPLRILIMAGFVGYSLGLATMPRLAGASDMSLDGSRFHTALRLVTCLQSALIAPWLVLIAPNATIIFGEGFAESSDVLYALTPYFFLTGIAPLASLATIYAGGERQRIVPTLTALGVNAGVTLLLLGPVGIVGAAIGVNLGSLVYVALFLTLCGRLLSIPRHALIRVVLVPLAAGLVLAALAVGAWFINPALGVAALIPVAVCHVAILRATGMLSEEELAQLTRLARHPLRSVGR